MAPLSHAVHSSHVKWWLKRAASHQLPAFPLSVEAIKIAGALLKAGGYRSAPQYLSAMRKEHVIRGHGVDEFMEMEFKEELRSREGTG